MTVRDHLRDILLRREAECERRLESIVERMGPRLNHYGVEAELAELAALVGVDRREVRRRLLIIRRSYVRPRHNGVCE